jgi:hypothetical protein
MASAVETVIEAHALIYALGLYTDTNRYPYFPKKIGSPGLLSVQLSLLLSMDMKMV